MKLGYLILFLTIFNCTLFSQEVDGGNGHALILDENGLVWTIGRNNHGQLGDGSFQNSSIPKRITNLPKIKVISRGYDHSLAIDFEGNIWAWGLNNYGQLGSSKLGNYNTPTKLDGHSNFKSVKGGHWHSIGLKEDGSVWSWGHNYHGELGHNNREHCSYPIPVLTIKEDEEDSASITTFLSGISDIKSVGAHTLALDSAGNIWGWGSNPFYQLLPEKSNVIKTAVKIEGLPKIKSIATGWHHSIALDIDGNVWAWGSDPSGQFRESTTKFFRKPTKFENIPKIMEVACGSWHSLAIDINGEVWGWGKNHFGMLGIGDTISHSFPVKIEGINQACKIGAGCFQSMVTDKQGKIWTFGDNPSGQLGLFDKTRRLEPSISLLSADGTFDSEKFKEIKNDKYWRSISLNNFYKLVDRNRFLTMSIVFNLLLCIVILRKRKQKLKK